MNNNLHLFNEELDNIKPKKILIVDDLPHNLRLLYNTLKENGYEVRCAKSGSMALIGVKQYKPDLILLDIKLPDLDGYEVCKQLKANPISKDIPIVFLSALDNILDKTKAFAVGGADYISKPFQIAEVLTRIEHQLSLISAKAQIRHLNSFLERKVQQRTAELQQEIIERIEAQMQAKQDRDKLESILNSLKEVVLSIDADNWQLIYLNPAAEKVYNRPAIDFFNNQNIWLEVIYAEDRQRVEQSFSQLKSEGNVKTIEVEYRIVRSGGEIRWLNDRRHVVYDNRGTALRIDAIINDITDRKQSEQRLTPHNFYDILTGLPNRTLFIDRLEMAIKRIEDTSEYSFTVLSIDLDGFTNIENDLGNFIAERLLIEVAGVFKESLRANDTLALWKKDRFNVILEQIDRVAEATNIVDRIETALKSPFNIEGHNIVISASIGIVMGSSNYQSASQLLRDADIAIQEAKQDNTRNYQVFERQVSAENFSMLSIESELQLALDRQEFLIYYQPIINLSDLKLIAFEALLRWQNPERGLIAPDNFIAIAKQSNLILHISEWMLDRVCRQLSAWQNQFDGFEDVKISVNITGRQIRALNFIDLVDRILEARDLDGSCLQLEIPESDLLEEMEVTETVLRKIKNRKIAIGVDNFGAGYSSLRYLHRLPIDSLKIERSFVNNMDSNRENLEIVRTLITVCNCLGKRAIAMGVETAQQLAQLQSFGCEQAQGYFFCKPLNSNAVESIVSVNSHKPFQ